uniref:Uncharacterized protein n=1 Tax=Bracon brevicornis TaxID=1563983 RepID=A0A6V7LMG0_9HYME
MVRYEFRFGCGLRRGGATQRIDFSPVESSYFYPSRPRSPDQWLQKLKEISIPFEFPQVTPWKTLEKKKKRRRGRKQRQGTSKERLNKRDNGADEERSTRTS